MVKPDNEKESNPREIAAFWLNSLYFYYGIRLNPLVRSNQAVLNYIPEESLLEMELSSTH